MESIAPTVAGTVNRIPQSTDKTMKRGCVTNNDIVLGGGGPYNTNSATKQHDSKRQKMEWDLEPFPKLNPMENSAHAQRITSRYKMIMKGKNTIGYNVYCQQVPKHLRRIRSMDTPNTPDHTLDIPSKRWQGLVKAWYVVFTFLDLPVVFTAR
jgi:hypothetical protein